MGARRAGTNFNLREMTMANATIKGFIHANTSGYGDKFMFFATEDMTACGYVKVMPYAFEVEIQDDFNYVAAKVAGLEKQKEKLRDEFNRRVMEINDEISKLQCLEFQAPGTA